MFIITNVIVPGLLRGGLIKGAQADTYSVGKFLATKIQPLAVKTQLVMVVVLSGLLVFPVSLM